MDPEERRIALKADRQRLQDWLINTGGATLSASHIRPMRGGGERTWNSKPVMEKIQSWKNFMTSKCDFSPLRTTSKK